MHVLLLAVGAHLADGDLQVGVDGGRRQPQVEASRAEHGRVGGEGRARVRGVRAGRRFHRPQVHVGLRGDARVLRVLNALSRRAGVGVGIGPPVPLRAAQGVALVEVPPLRRGGGWPLAHARHPAGRPLAAVATRLPPHPEPWRLRLVAVVDALEIMVEIGVEVLERRRRAVHAVIAVGEGGVQRHVRIDAGEPVDRSRPDLFVLPGDHRVHRHVDLADVVDRRALMDQLVVPLVLQRLDEGVLGHVLGTVGLILGACLVARRHTVDGRGVRRIGLGDEAPQRGEAVVEDAAREGDVAVDVAVGVARGNGDQRHGLAGGLFSRGLLGDEQLGDAGI